MGQPTERDEALETPEDAAVTAADAPAVAGEPENDGAATEPAPEVAPAPEATPEPTPEPAPEETSETETMAAVDDRAAEGSPALDDEDETPYVPRVFAFDPDAPAVLQPPAAATGPEPQEAPAEGSPVPTPSSAAPEEPTPVTQEGQAPAEPSSVPEPAAVQQAPEAPAVVEEAAPEAPVSTDAHGQAGEPTPAATPASAPSAPDEPGSSVADEPGSSVADEPGSSVADEPASSDEGVSPYDAAVPDETAVPDEAAPSAPAEPAPSGQVDAATPGPGAVDAAADETRVVPVVEPVVPAVEPAAAPAAPDASQDATQVLPPVEPWARPDGPTRTSVLPATSAPDTSQAGTAHSAGTDPAGTDPAGTDPAGTGPAATEPVGAGAAPAAAPGAAGPFGPVPPDEERVTSPFEGFEEDAPRRGWVRGLLWTGVAVLVLGGLYAAAQWYFSDKVPSGTTVAGVDVGGLSRGDAQDELAASLGPRAAEPVTLAAGDATTTMDPAAAGLTFDAGATAEELTAFSMNPVRLWDHLVGGGEEEPVVRVDEAALDAQVEVLRGSLEVEPTDGTVQFVDGVPTATPAADGTELVADEATRSIVDGWLVTDGPIELATTPVGPDVTQEETDAALAEAQQVVSAPVVVSVSDQSPELPVEVLAGAASFTPTDGDLVLTFDGALLVEAVVERTNDLLTAADDAHFEFSGGVPVIAGGEPGTTIEPQAIADAVATAATSTDRTAAVELVESDPAQSVAALEALGVEEKVSEFSTPLTNNALRTDNLRVGASKVNGQLVLPGETFSLTEALSPITVAGGYHSAGIVENGRHVDGVGGGLSQMATTVYNAAFFAGLEDVEHRQHSYWFSRYPAGREATIYVGALDLKFKNDTPYGVLMQSWVGGGELHVAVWSTKHFEVETSASGRSNVVEPTTVTQSGPDCAPTPAGNPGFSITNYRKVYLDGELVKDEADRWTYKPDNEVVCAP